MISQPPPLPAIDLDNILLNENAYFYKKKSDFTNQDILKIFRQSLDDKKAERKYKPLIRQPLTDGIKTVARYSLDIFEFKTKPTFFEKAEPRRLEVKYGLFLILEKDDYVAVVRKNVSGIKELYDKIKYVDYEVLSHFLITNKSRFEKINSSSMNTAENAIHNRASEGADLKKTMSRFGISKQILNAMRVDNKGKKNTIALNTSRVNSFNLKNKFHAVLFWMVEMIRLIDRAYDNLPASTFLDGFARPLKFEDCISELEPTYILLRFINLKSEIEDEEIEKTYRKEDDGTEKEIDLIDIINTNEKLFPLTKVNDELYEFDDIKVKINKSSITVSSEELKSIMIDYGDGDRISLSNHINYGANFMINFNKIDHVYSHGKIFKDSKLLGDLENFFNTFIADPALSTVRSEKGENYKSNSSSFSKDSLFHFIDTSFGKDNLCVICDDMGVEWGDFIAISQDEITFVHAKYQGKVGLSATNLEVIFGQAMKNLGSLELNDDMIEYRKERWLKEYKIDGVQTNISRIRKCPNTADKISKIKELAYGASSNGNFRKRIFIVLNFISKSQLEQAVSELKKGKMFTHKGVTLQILWFVNSLLASAQELNTELRIVCQP